MPFFALFAQNGIDADKHKTMHGVLGCECLIFSYDQVLQKSATILLFKMKRAYFPAKKHLDANESG